MRVFAPYVSFESWSTRGFVLEVVMQERILAAHVRSVLNHLRLGYQETSGTAPEALSNALNLNFIRPAGLIRPV